MVVFNEKEKEKGMQVEQTQKYIQARQKAIELINSGKYGLTEADFWILKNKNGDKMNYTGLIISHNGCLKINDNLDDKDKFRPMCVEIDKNGYANSLVFIYCCPDQKIFEIGEVSNKNLLNNYPYAMALKRLFDRVVLKISKLAFDGIYSVSESDEFKEENERKVTDEQRKTICALAQSVYGELWKTHLAAHIKTFSQEYESTADLTYAEAQKTIKDLTVTEDDV